MAKKSGKTVTPKATTIDHKSKISASKYPKNTGPRRLKQSRYTSLKLQKRIKHPVRLPSAWRLTKVSVRVLWRRKSLFFGIVLIYGLLNLLLVQGLANNTDVGSLKGQLNQVFTGHFGSLASSLSVFALLVSSAGNGSSQTAGAYQFFLALIASLAIIWTLRQVVAQNGVRIRDAYYRGMYPLIPFILVLLMVALQLVPLLIGSALYSAVIANGIAVYFVEKLLWVILCVSLALLSLYMVSSSLFALYIVTLPDMTPMKALRSARELVRHRRWTVLRKILYLPLALLAAAAFIMVPVIIWAAPLAQWVFFLLTMCALASVHAYMYSLYRELLNE